MPLTEYQKTLFDVLKHLRKRVEAIDGPYSKMVPAFRALSDLEGEILEGDEVMAHCEICDEPLLTMDNFATSDDGVAVCADCIEANGAEDR